MCIRDSKYIADHLEAEKNSHSYVIQEIKNRFAKLVLVTYGDFVFESRNDLKSIETNNLGSLKAWYENISSKLHLLKTYNNELYLGIDFSEHDEYHDKALTLYELRKRMAERSIEIVAKLQEIKDLTLERDTILKRISEMQALVDEYHQTGKLNRKKALNFYENKTVRKIIDCLLYTSPSPRDRTRSRMPSSA